MTSIGARHFYFFSRLHWLCDSYSRWCRNTILPSSIHRLTVLLIHDTSESEDNFFCSICPDSPTQSWISLRIIWKNLRNFVERPIMCKASSSLYLSLPSCPAYWRDPRPIYWSWHSLLQDLLPFPSVRARPRQTSALQAAILDNELCITLIRFILRVFLCDRNHFSTLVIIHYHDLRFAVGSLLPHVLESLSYDWMTDDTKSSATNIIQ